MIKTVTFAIMHFAIAFTVTYFLTGSFLIGGLVAIVEPAVNTVAFYFHEKVWRKVENQNRFKQDSDAIMLA
ncbi:DUF2061 domain-containing protein [Pseudoalteromonas sp. CO302Y]|uniref:DUF2061 domain-containing protein n=1 Tax=unclassified Pseudoalteromonas TaxID=194690 RepID=UPI001022B8B7|nr:DUF2061 domain-containing protein [Pseudoalteromonas sp. CO302Y]RZG05929.1 DUF2061 domain-containing protein [Pseudoalteromonas sp. CO133X]